MQDEIPEYTIPYADDIPVQGPATQYELDSRGYKVLAENPGIHWFMWEHLLAMLRIVQSIKAMGGTVLAKKTIICGTTAGILGHLWTYEGRQLDGMQVQRIADWPECKILTEVQAFLGTKGFMHVFICNFAMIAQPFVWLTKKGVAFEFGKEQREAMRKLKEAILNSKALQAIDYESS